MDDSIENFLERAECTELIAYGTDRLLRACRILFDSHKRIAKGSALTSCETLRAATYKGCVSESREAIRLATEAINAT